ncbi:MAG: dihydroorotate dehydrogenase [Actinomycetota bacterium]
MATADLSVDLAGIRLRSPVVTASGCFASGREVSEFVDLKKLGAIVVKSMTIEPWAGKPTPRMAETPSGMLNAIGLQNHGVDHFLEVDLPWLNRVGVPVIASIAGNTVQEYIYVSERLHDAPGVIAIEVNISCPNLEDRSNMFAHDPKATAQVIGSVRRGTDIPLFAKLSPNVTSLPEIAGAALDAGAAGLSLINTVMGMAIDVETGRPRVAGVMGGLSGPAIRPIAVRSVFEVHKAFPHVPIIGMGGIMNHEDALEFVLAGASAVALGTANFIDPMATMKVSEGIAEYMVRKGVSTLASMRGRVKIEG